MSNIMWFRRDLRIKDNPAFLEACKKDVLPLFILDPILWDQAGPPRKHALASALKALDESLGHNLVLRMGSPEKVLVDIVKELNVKEVFVSQDFAPYGRKRDQKVKEALRAVSAELTPVGSPYLKDPGTVLKPNGSSYKVYTPFFNAWKESSSHVAAFSAPDLDKASFLSLPVDKYQPVDSAVFGASPSPDLLPAALVPHLGEVSEKRASELLENFLLVLKDYDVSRDRPDKDGTSSLSAQLKYGTIHPRTILSFLNDPAVSASKGAETFRKELAWREFNADLLFRDPLSAYQPSDPRFKNLEVDSGLEADQKLLAWKNGKTGFPMVDAGMRQLLTTGWMHNRVRMLVASFLVKDLHLPWQVGARWFMENLIDGDLPSNSHGWQWVAGSGFDASPFFRVFNPLTQGKKFDPHGRYVRRFVSELSSFQGDVHDLKSLPSSYSRPIVDHAQERKEALRRFALIK